MATTLMLAAALNLAACGFHVFPVVKGGKTPLINKWPERATTDKPTIKEWWDLWPDANIGCHPGRSGHVVIDVDVKGGVDGFASLRESFEGLPIVRLATTRKEAKSTGWNVETPSGGMHIWYTLPEGRTVSSPANWKLGVDIRSTGGYVLMPPSVIDGRKNPYEWTAPLLSRTGS